VVNDENNPNYLFRRRILIDGASHAPAKLQLKDSATRGSFNGRRCFEIDGNNRGGGNSRPWLKLLSEIEANGIKHNFLVEK